MRLRRSWASIDAIDRRTLAMIVAVVGSLHLLAALLLVALLLAHHGGAATFAIGIGVTAYTLGLRHAFDADHIAAIDNATRTLMRARKRPLSAGLWFSLGHSTVVLVLACAVSLGVRSLQGQVSSRSSGLHQVADWIGTLVSGGFLYLIAALNVLILLGILATVREMKTGSWDEGALEAKLASRGLMNRFLGKMTTRISRPRQLYRVGLLFGLGFDTATEVTLLVLAARAAGSELPWYAVVYLPTLFAAGMSLMDSIDGAVMSFAYGWALVEPVRKVFYNLAVTGLSVAVALVIGTLELAGLIASKLRLTGPFWHAIERIDINTLGFVIVGIFILAWVVALLAWRLGHIETRWSRR